MAASKEREIEILEYKIANNKRILENWIRFDVSERKIQKMEAKIAREEEALANLKNQ